MKTKFTLLLTIGCLTSLFAQVKDNEIYLRNETGHAKIIKLKETKVSDDPQAINIFLKSQYGTVSEIEFKRIKPAKIDKLGFKVEKIQQYYKGVKVEYGVFNTVSKNGELKSVNGNFTPVNNIKTNPNLTESEALKFALTNIDAKEYIWENKDWEKLIKEEKNDQNASYYPKGELVILTKNVEQPTLVYKFRINALNPFSSDDVYVNATNGDIVFKNNLLRHVIGTSDTRYSGQRAIETEQVGTQFRLRDNTRGDGIQTFNLRGHGNNYGVADDITDNDNNWTALEYNNANLDNAALDTHWGAMMTYDYFLQEHGRNSIDNNGFILRNYVHADLRIFGLANNDNAFWWNERMTYGDGEIQFDAVVSLDVIAHEIGHGFYDNSVGTALYERESGAINEGLSDIWGALVENFAAPEKEAYLIGEDITLLTFALRSMSDPHSRNQPDTYGANDPFWFNPDCGTPNPNTNDNCGVHTNSGVLNYWFFLLAEGDTGTNENGDFYNIDGIGSQSAAQIIYRAQTIYFTPSTDFEAARIHTIQAAEDLFGVNSIEAITTNNAWYSVGLGDLIIGQLEGDVSACYSPNTTFTLTNFSNQPVNWQVSSNLIIVSSNNTSITVRATNSSIKATGFIIANIGGEQIRKDIWVGRPSSPTSNIYGPTTVAYGAIVNYSGPSVLGASSYKWYLPYPYDPNATVSVDPPKWGILSGGNSRYLSAIVGSNDGLVQFMGVNKCGTGGAKTLSVSVGSSNGGGIKPGGGNIPLNLDANNHEGIKIYPNPVDAELTIVLNSDADNYITLYDAQSKIMFTKKTNKSLEKINLSNLKNGIYFLKIYGENSVIHKIIVQH